MRFLFVISLMVLAGFSYSQSTQESFLSAKAAFNTGNFSTAEASFSSLVNDPTFGAYATFYYALSLHHQKKNDRSLDAWRQLKLKYPQFDQMKDVHYWMVSTFFDHRDYLGGVEEAQFLKDNELQKDLYDRWLREKPFAILMSLSKAFPSDGLLAEVALAVGLKSKLTPEENEFLTGLKTLFPDKFSNLKDFPEIKKEVYSVAVFLPFLFDGLKNTDKISKNTLVMGIYQGMRLAEEMLNEKDSVIRLYPFDTRRDADHTQVVMNSKGMDKVDLIVGPLFTEPMEVISFFSRSNEINMINPVSSNSQVMENNPFSFLLKPSYETMAKATADFMASEKVREECMIYFENKEPEKTLAKAYRAAIIENGFNVTNFQPIDNKTAREVLARFSDQEEVVLNLSDEEALRLKDEGRLIREREKYDASGRLITKEDGTPKWEYYEMVFTYDTDSLDHIFAVTRSNLLANNFVGAVESIIDTVKLVGLGDWLNFSMLDYRQLERLGVYLINQDHMNRESLLFREVIARYEKKYGERPDDFALMGFESIWWAGHMLRKHGKYFQNGFYSPEQEVESIFYGHQFEPGRNDNKKVPIVQFRDQKLKAINFVNESDEE